MSIPNYRCLTPQFLFCICELSRVKGWSRTPFFHQFDSTTVCIIAILQAWPDIFQDIFMSAWVESSSQRFDSKTPALRDLCGLCERHSVIWLRLCCVALSEVDLISKKPHLIFEMGFCFLSASFSHPVLHKTKQRAWGMEHGVPT